MYLRSLKRRTETCVDGEVNKGEAEHKWGLSRLRYDVLGFVANPDFGVYPDSKSGFGFSTLWLVNTPEMGDTTCGFYDLSMLSSNMGARGCDGMCR
jgi:hypothetical protein